MLFGVLKPVFIVSDSFFLDPGSVLEVVWGPRLGLGVLFRVLGLRKRVPLVVVGWLKEAFLKLQGGFVF